MKTQAIRSHHVLWVLLLLAAIVIGFFILTVKPVAQAPNTPANAVTEGSQSGQAQPADSTVAPANRN